MKPQEEAAKKEEEIWHTIFQEPSVRQLTLANSPALIMPVVDQPTSWDVQHKDAIREAVKAYSAHHFATDLKKDHVGFITDATTGQLKAVLFDTRPGNAKTGGEAEMLKKLGL